MFRGLAPSPNLRRLDLTHSPKLPLAGVSERLFSSETLVSRAGPDKRGIEVRPLHVQRKTVSYRLLLH